MSRAHFIDGKWTPSLSDDRIEVLNPATRQVLDDIPSGSGDDADELAMAQTRENGKPLGMSRGDMGAATGTLEQFAELGPLHRGRSLVGAWDAVDTMAHEPYGVAACVAPWNDPPGVAAQMLAATLVTGNTVVLKPSEKTPVVLHTGSIATGRRIAERCGALMKKAVLELGGKDPVIVDRGVDPDWAAEQVAAGAFANCGQICTSVERVYVHADIAEAFTTRLAEKAVSIRYGDPADSATRMGPLLDERQRDIVHRHVTEAVAQGARVLTGGNSRTAPASTIRRPSWPT